MEEAPMYKVIKFLIIGWTIFCLFGVIVGLIAVGSGPQPTTEAEKAGAAIGAALGLGFWAVVWFIPTVGLAVIALLVRPRELEATVPAQAPATLCPECGKYFAGKQNFCPHCGKPVIAPL
jgi:uncharacterized BrkB/YihY/UPF0761 family membrane protein